jgi:CubicO group peptidase (beta-lactamase class C family)
MNGLRTFFYMALLGLPIFSTQAQDLERPADISLETLQFGPHNRWAFSHLREMITTVNISKDKDFTRSLPSSAVEPQDVIINWKGSQTNLTDVLASQYNDGILVLKDGEILVEGYFGALTEQRPHAMFSMSKSVVGIIAAILENKGMVDLSKPVSFYVPELIGSGYGEETLRRLMDMRDGTNYTETYADINSTVQVSDCSAGFYGGKACPETYPETVYEVLESVGRDEGAANLFNYKSGNTDAVAWALEVASGEKLSTLVEENLWETMGAEHNASITVDMGGFEYANGGMSATLRDMGRFGQLLLENGALRDEQIIPKEHISDIREHLEEPDWMKGDRADGFFYRSFFWGSGGDNNDFMAAGIHGQRVYISPDSNMVIVLFSSWPTAGGNGTDHGWQLSLDLISAMIEKYSPR